VAAQALPVKTEALTAIPEAPVEPVSPAALPYGRPRVNRKWMGIGLAAVMVAGVGVYLVSRARASVRAAASAWTPEMTALWKPFLGEDTPLTIAFEIRQFFFSPSTGLVVRDFRTNAPEDLPKSAPLSRFQKEMKAEELQPNSDYADQGAVHAAFLLGQLLGPQHRDIGVKHAGALGWEDLWNSNVIFLGKPNLHPAIRYNLQGREFVEDENGTIRNVHPRTGEEATYRSASTHGSGVKYALISVLPGPQAGHHVMILSGAGSEFLWALAQYVSDPTHVKELVSRLRLPSGEMPGSFQVLIQATFESNVPISIRYVTHRIASAS
jgi:hypothetical protein